MCNVDLQQKGLATLVQRVQDLICDGYTIFIKYHDASVALVRMRHTNGNTITLKYNIHKSLITQTTNGKITHSQEVR